MPKLVTNVGGTEKIRGIYTFFTREGRVAQVCNCGACQRERTERGEEPTLPMDSVTMSDRIKYFADNGINLIIPCLPEEVIFQGLLPFDEPLATWERDPLTDLIDVAHRNGIEVHPVYWGPAGKAPKPEWGMVNAEGRAVDRWDPGKPEVREFFVQVAVNLVEKYDVDGLSMDGIRYCEMEMTGDCCYCDTCRADFSAQYGFDPISIALSGKDSIARKREQSIQPGQYLWNITRQNHITTIVRSVKSAIQSVRSGVKLSAYVWGCASNLVFQNWPDWLDDQALDWINPSGYTYGEEAFKRRCLDTAHLVGGRVPFAMTLGPHTSHGKVRDLDELIYQIRTAQQVGASGVVFFTHSHRELHENLPRLAKVAL